MPRNLEICDPAGAAGGYIARVNAFLKSFGHVEIDRAKLRFSYEIFSEYGNMSSPSVLFVLQRVIERGRPKRG
ncbi:MAG: hypothetical protein V1929_01420 [bacterium]